VTLFEELVLLVAALDAAQVECAGRPQDAADAADAARPEEMDR
jgi:hypothetical protein